MIFNDKKRLCFFLVLIFYFVLALYPLVRYSGNATWFNKLGVRFALNEEKLPTNALLFKGLGYDGQFYFYMALDPFLLKEKKCECIDSPPYRYGRIGFPFLAGLLAGWNKDVLPWTFLILNLLCLVGLLWVVYHMLLDLKIPPLYAAAFCLTPGLMISFLYSTLELPAIFFVAAGLYALDKKKTIWGAVLLAYAPLIRETALMANIVGLIFGKSYTGKKVNRGVFISGFVTYGAWQYFLATQIGSSLRNTSNFGQFFEGLFGVIQAPWHINQKVLPVFVVLSLAVLLPLLLFTLMRKRNMALLASSVWGLLILKYPVSFWSNNVNFFRALVDFSFWALLASASGLPRWPVRIFLILNVLVSVLVYYIESKHGLLWLTL